MAMPRTRLAVHGGGGELSLSATQCREGTSGPEAIYSGATP
ncbi:hypothetical protein [Streptomyces sp. NPDC059863]